MIKKVLCATLALGSSLGLLLAADAFTGSWKLDVAQSTFASDNPAPRELTLTFTEQGANRTQILKGIATSAVAGLSCKRRLDLIRAPFVSSIPLLGGSPPVAPRVHPTKNTSTLPAV